MNEFLDRARELLDDDMARAALRAAAILLVGVLIARIVRRRVKADALRAQHRMLLLRLLSGLIYGVTFAWAISELGLNVGVLLGAAGVLTVAIGFAAQASVSNLVSGLFLMVEQPFKLEDVIKVGDTTGEVLAIDLMSTKLRTFDNLYVRIPNETMLKAEVTNFTHFPIRRYDMMLGVAYHHDALALRELLFQVARDNKACLEEPAPQLIFLGFGDSALSFQFSFWSERAKFLELRTSMYIDVKRALDANGIEIPFPHRTMYVGSQSSPWPVTIVPPNDAQPPCA